jgi:hypothetical protein
VVCYGPLDPDPMVKIKQGRGCSLASVPATLFRRGRAGSRRRRRSGDPGDQRRGARGAARLGELACMIGVPRRGLLRRLHADGGFPGDGGSDVDVAIDFLQGKVQGWSEKKRKREGREKGKDSATLARGFVVQGSRWLRCWEVSVEQFCGSGSVSDGGNRGE